MPLVPALTLSFFASWMPEVVTATNAPDFFGIEGELGYINRQFEPNMIIDKLHMFNQTTGMFAHAFVGDELAEAYLGIRYQPELDFGWDIGLGPERAPIPLRLGTSFHIGQEGLELRQPNWQLTLEIGGNWLWYQSIFRIPIDQVFGIGLMLRRYSGLGPRIEYVLPGTRLRLSISYLCFEPELMMMSSAVILSLFWGVE